MPQITSGSNATFTVPAGYVIDVQCPGGWVQLEYPVGTRIFEGNPAGQAFGPYSGGTAKLTSVKGDIYYEVDPNASGSKPYDPSSVDIRGGNVGTMAVATAYSYAGGKTPYSLVNTRRALAAAQASVLNGNGAGAARSPFLFIGDSTVFGLHSGNNGLYVRRNAWPAYLARILAQQGYGGVSSGIFGDGAAANLNGGDDRLTAGAGWSNVGTVFAQNCWQQTAAGGSLTWTPDSAVDTVDVYYLTFSGLGTFTVDNGGAAFITQNSGAISTATLAKVSATIASSANPINAKWSSGGAVKILGIRAYTAASTGIDCLNAGVNGQTTAGWIASGAYSYAALIGYLAPACTFISLGFNDLNTAYPVASYQAGLQSLATGAQNGGTGDVVFLIQHPQKITSHSIAAQKAYWDAANAAAAAVGACVVNLPGRWVSGETQAAMLYDDTHPNALGHFDIARAVADVILGQ